MAKLIAKFGHLAILFLLSNSSPTFGHILFTFPEPRYPPFDLLDNQRTVGLCGVPKSARSQITHFQLDRMYNLSWRMAQEGQGPIQFALIDQHGQLVANGVKRSANGNGSTTEPIVKEEGARSVELQFPVECRNCTLLLEKQTIQFGPKTSERSCADVDIVARELSPSEQCSGNGKWHGNGGEQGGKCQCEHGFSGQYCQNKDDCQSNEDCGIGGECVEDGVVKGQRSCFCQFGFYGTNCERRSDPDPEDQHCFRHNGPSLKAGTKFRYGLFNPDCYEGRKELNADGDHLYWRLLGNQLELLLDFQTNSWLALGWRPLQIPPACRLFPQIISSETELARTSGFSREYLLDSPLHPMDCVDMVMGIVREEGRLHVADMYSRDRSSPLKDTLLDGEESLSAAYGWRSGNRSVLMFRRLVPEIEPTDHPLGPGTLFVIHAKGGGGGGQMDKKDGQWRYHGNGSLNRGHLELEFVPQSKMNRLRGPLIHLDSTESGESKAAAEVTKSIGNDEIATKTKTKATASSTIPTVTNELPTATTIPVRAATGRLVKDWTAVGSIWVRPTAEGEDQQETTVTTQKPRKSIISSTITERQIDEPIGAEEGEGGGGPKEEETSTRPDEGENSLKGQENGAIDMAKDDQDKKQHQNMGEDTEVPNNNSNNNNNDKQKGMDENGGGSPNGQEDIRHNPDEGEAEGDEANRVETPAEADLDDQHQHQHHDHYHQWEPQQSSAAVSNSIRRTTSSWMRRRPLVDGLMANPFFLLMLMVTIILHSFSLQS